MYRIKNLKDTYSTVRTNVVEVMDAFIKKQCLQYPIPLGPEFNSLEPHEVDAHLRAYRMSKNWQLPADSNTAERRKKSIQAMLQYDASGPDRFHDPLKDLDPWLKMLLNLAHLDLQLALKRHYRFRPENLRIPSGESSISAKGDVSLFAKLRDRSQWNVTADCFDLAAEVIYSVPSLKSSFKAHFPEYTQEEVERLNLAFTSSNGRVNGFEVFKCRLLDVVNIVPGMRLETVPKDNEKDRVIACEPLLNMLVQSVVEEGIRHVMLVHYGVDLDTAQVLHGYLISDPENATVDLKNASNSFFLNGLDTLYSHTLLRDHILASRSPSALFDGVEHTLKMVAPMGNGFTFGYMSLTILAIARQLDTFAHVYGDDIIIDRHVAPTLIQCLEALGCKTNDKKTFLQEGGFKESCGKFYSTDHYVVSYEFTYPETIIECVTLVNKVHELALLGLDDWVALHKTLVSLFSPIHYMWYETSDCVKDPTTPYGADIESRFILVHRRSDMRKKRTDFLSRELWAAEVATRSSWLEKIQCEARHMSAVIHLSYRKDLYRKLPTNNVSGALLSYYLYTLRCTAPERRVRSDQRGVNLNIQLVPYWSGELCYPQRAP